MYPSGTHTGDRPYIFTGTWKFAGWAVMLSRGGETGQSVGGGARMLVAGSGVGITGVAVGVAAGVAVWAGGKSAVDARYQASGTTWPRRQARAAISTSVVSARRARRACAAIDRRPRDSRPGRVVIGSSSAGGARGETLWSGGSSIGEDLSFAACAQYTHHRRVRPSCHPLSSIDPRNTGRPARS
jgi:hypothetical protein